MKKLMKKLSMLSLVVVMVVLVMGATPTLFQSIGLWRVEAKAEVEVKEGEKNQEESQEEKSEELLEETEETDEAADDDQSEEIEEKPPLEKPDNKPDKMEKIAYLTFDDGPTPGVTSGILDILTQQQIKATFFVIGDLVEKYPQLVLRANDEGHLICNHTYTHNYKTIYSSPDAFMADLMQGEVVLKNLLGSSYTSKIMRFPGGSFGEGKSAFRERVLQEGFVYIDWNALNGDAEAKYVSVEKQLSRIKETAKGKKEIVVLMHDSGGKKTTLEALPLIINYLQEEGYIFKTLAEYEI